VDDLRARAQELVNLIGDNIEDGYPGNTVEDVEAALSSMESVARREEREACAGAITVLRDRLFSALAFVAHVVEELDEDIEHEDAVDIVCRSHEAIRATDSLDPIKRGYKGWERDAQLRLAAIRAMKGDGE
jgi:hypothetical protein